MWPTRYSRARGAFIDTTAASNESPHLADGDDGAADASDAAKDAAVCRGRGRELEAELAAKLADLVHGTL